MALKGYCVYVSLFRCSQGTVSISGPTADYLDDSEKKT